MAKTWKHAYEEGRYRISNSYGFMRITRANKWYVCHRYKFCEEDPDHQIVRGTYYVSLVSGWRATVSRSTGEVVGYKDGSPVEGTVAVDVPRAHVKRFHIGCLSPWIEWIAGHLAERPRGRQRTYTDEENKARRKLIDRRKYLFRKVAATDSLSEAAVLLQEIEILHQQLGDRFNLRSTSPLSVPVKRVLSELKCPMRLEGYPYCAPDAEGRCIHCGRSLL